MRGADEGIFPRELEKFWEGSFPFLKEKGHVISLVGAGGKSTLMDAFARHYARKGQKVIITTTTHILRPQAYPVAETLEGLKAMVSQGKIVAAGTDAPGHKLKMAENMGIADYQKAADTVLAEADGAKHFPCKVPLDFEPVIPQESDIVIGVVGIDAMGKPLQEACFRKERAMELLQAGAGHLLTEQDLAKILSSSQGIRKGVGSREYYIVINKCNTPVQKRQAEKIKQILKGIGIGHTICLS